MRVLLHKGPMDLVAGKGWIHFAGWRPLADYINGNADMFIRNKVEILVDFNVDPEIRVSLDYSHKGLTKSWIPSVAIENQLLDMVKRGGIAQVLLRAIRR